MVSTDGLPDPQAIAGNSGGSSNSNLAPGWSLASASPEEIIQVQRILSDAGMISGSVPFGTVDQKTASAFGEILNNSQASGRPPSEILAELSASNTARSFGAAVAQAGSRISEQASAGPSRAPFSAQVSNPADLRRFFKQAVINATGEFKGQVDIDKMVEAYQATERNAQAAAYNAAPSGGTVEQGISPDAFVEDALAESVPDEVQTRDVVDRAGQLFDMLGSFGGQ